MSSDLAARVSGSRPDTRKECLMTKRTLAQGGAHGNGGGGGGTPLERVLARLHQVKPYGGGYSAPCPAHQDRKPSLSIRTGDDGRVLLKCHAGCPAEKIVAALGLRMRDLFPQNGNGHRGAYGDAAPPRRVARSDGSARAEGAVARILRESIPDPGRVAEYLRHRGLSGVVPDCLSFHPALPYYDGGGHRPKGKYQAMIARVQDVHGEIRAVHRTYLDQSGPGKALVATPKKAFGAVRGGAIRLIDLGETLALAEGVETALAVQEATATAAWATLGASGMRTVVLPPQVQRVEIWVDRDEAGRQAADALAVRLHREGRVVFLILPPAE